MKGICLLAAMLCAGSGAQAHFVSVQNRCPDADFTELQRSVVSLTFEYAESVDDVIGHTGTAWFLTPTKLVTVSHVTDGALSANEWQSVLIGWEGEVRAPQTEQFPFEARITAVYNTGLFSMKTGAPENVVVFELRGAIAGTQPAPVRFAPLQRDEPVVAVGYRGVARELQWARGHYSPPEPSQEPSESTDEPLQPFLYFEMSNEEGKDRFVLDHGTSGAPVFDCSGKVVAVVSGIITTELEQFPAVKREDDGSYTFLDEPMRVTPSVGQANNTGVSVAVIDSAE